MKKNKIKGPLRYAFDKLMLAVFEIINELLMWQTQYFCRGPS